MSLGKNVRKLREAKGWEQKDLATASGVSNGTISAIEVRDSKRSAVAPALARALGVTLEQLLSDDMDAVPSLPLVAATPAPSGGASCSGVTLDEALEVVAQALSQVPADKRQTLLGVLATYSSQPAQEANALAYLSSELAKTQPRAGLLPSDIATGKPPGGGA